MSRNDDACLNKTRRRAASLVARRAIVASARAGIANSPDPVLAASVGHKATWQTWEATLDAVSAVEERFDVLLPLEAQRLSYGRLDEPERHSRRRQEGRHPQQSRLCFWVGRGGASRHVLCPTPNLRSGRRSRQSGGSRSSHPRCLGGIWPSFSGEGGGGGRRYREGGARSATGCHAHYASGTAGLRRAPERPARLQRRRIRREPPVRPHVRDHHGRARFPFSSSRRQR